MKKRTWIWILCVVPLVLSLTGQPAGQNLNLGSESQREAGKVLYDQYCAQCHGTEGDGEGIATPFVRPKPRDFTSGKFKIRTTPSGALPTDEDLRRVIREGMPYTTMIDWPEFSDQEVENIIYYLKTFSPDFENPDYYEQPITIPDPPPFSTESAEQGREVYVQMECRRCHGDQGRGDGPSAPSLANDAGETILAADLTKRWTFRGGPTRQDIYRTFTTGLNGTPMPSYADSLSDEQRWQLVDYVYSLGPSDAPNYAEQLVSKSVDDELDLARGMELFAEAESAYFPLFGQIVQPGRAFHPAVTGIEVRAVHNSQEIAFLLRWHDMRADVAGENGPNLEAPTTGELSEAVAEEDPGTVSEPFADVSEEDVDESAGDDFWGDAAEQESEAEAGDDFWGDAAESEAEDDAVDDFWGEATDDEATDDFFSQDDSGSSAASESEFSDAVALQIPAILPEGIRLPYFLFGDLDNPVDLWFADLAQDDPQRFRGRGSRNLTPEEAEGLEMSAAYEAGEWTVVFKRERRVEDAMAIEDDVWYPVAFSVWDGWNEDRGNKRALTGWYYVYIEPEEKDDPLMPMAKAALATLGLEIILIALVRRKYRNGKDESEAHT